MARSMVAEENSHHNVHIGLGEAISRLIRVKAMIAMGVYPDEVLTEETRLIEEALNLQYQLDLGFDCNMDGVPDSVEIFAATANTSCCRLVQDKPKKTRGSSRAKSK